MATRRLLRLGLGRTRAGGRVAIVIVAACVAMGGCPRRPDAGSGRIPRAAAADEQSEPSLGTLPDGSSCGGRDDCSGDQVCVAGRCRYRHTSPGAEVLATAAKAQLDAGDLSGAVETYDQAIAAYRHADAPIPSEVLCGAASAALRFAHDAATREAAAKRADACFRGSMPGAPERVAVLRAIGKLRYQGLDLGLFDAETPAERFFTKKPSRPTLDAIEIATDVPDRDDPGYAKLAESLRSESSTRAIANCFIQDWDLRHERSAHAALLLKLETHLHDMGLYDVYDATVQITGTSLAQQGFEPCLARALTDALQPGPHMNRVVSWQEPIEISARLP